MSIVIYIAVMAGITYLIRMTPIVLIRREIQSRFLKSMMYYLPYAVLSAMTFPAILMSTGDTLSAAVGTIIALVTAFFELPLIVVALAATAGAAVVQLIPLLPIFH